MEKNQLEKKKNRSQSFVEFIINCSLKNKGSAAVLKRADNPITEYQSWEYLASFNIDLTNDKIRIPFALIASAVAKAKIKEDGVDNIGKALAELYSGESKADQGRMRLRRVLSCDSIEELCKILRPLFQLIQDRSNIRLNYSRLLDEILIFEDFGTKIKSRWAQDFYRILFNLNQDGDK